LSESVCCRIGRTLVILLDIEGGAFEGGNFKDEGFGGGGEKRHGHGVFGRLKGYIVGA
jgi:hypothetical protein